MLFAIILVVLYVLFSSFFVWNFYTTVPAISIAANLAAMYFIAISLRQSPIQIFKDVKSTPSLLLALLILNIVFDIFLILVRSAPDADSAVLWSIPMLATTYLLLVGLLYLLMTFPRRILSNNSRRAIISIYGLFSLFFLLPTYAYRALSNGQPWDIEKIGGVFPELAAIEAVFGPYSTVASLFFLTIAVSMILVSTYQLLSLDNKTVKGYYRIVWMAFTAAISVSIISIFFAAAVFHRNAFMFYALETIIFTPAVAYYVARISIVRRKVLSIRSGEETIGKMIIYVDDGPSDVMKAKKELLKHIEEGKRVIIFSSEDRETFLPGKKEALDRTLYIKVNEKGYLIRNTLFSTINDLVQLHEESMSDFRGMVVYANTLRRLIRNEFTYEEKKNYYYLIKRVIDGGALVISPVERRYLQVNPSAKIIRTDNPIWYMKPLMVMRLGEYLNEIYERIPVQSRKDFLEALIRMKERGLPYDKLEEGHIQLVPSADMDYSLFISLTGEIRNFILSKHILSEEEIDGMGKDLFMRYGDDYEAMILIRDGLVYFINGQAPEKESMEKAQSLARSGKNVMIISRTNPEILKKMYYFEEDVLVKWLTNLPDREDVIFPHLESVKKEIFDFLESRSDATVVFDGIEYLTRIHGFPPILDLLWILKDKVATTQSIMLIPVNLGALDDKDAETLKREFPFL